MMKKLMDQIKELFVKYKELILYCIVGAFTTVINFSAFYLLNSALGEDLYLVNNVIAVLIAITFSYIMSKLFVFESKSFAFKTVAREMLEFYSARFLSLIIDESGMWLFVEILDFDRFSFTVFGFTVTGKLIAKGILTVVVIILNYIFSKFVVFKKNKDNKARPA